MVVNFGHMRSREAHGPARVRECSRVRHRESASRIRYFPPDGDAIRILGPLLALCRPLCWLPHDLAFLSPRSQTGRTIERTHCLLRQDRVPALARHELAARFRSFCWRRSVPTLCTGRCLRRFSVVAVPRWMGACICGTCGAAYARIRLCASFVLFPRRSRA